MEDGPDARPPSSYFWVTGRGLYRRYCRKIPSVGE
jgi:hypothetical protein